MQIAIILKQIDGVPSEFQLLPYGEIEIEGEEPALLDEEAMAAVIADFKRRGNDLVIDYEHQTLSGGQAPAAGWIKALVNKGAEGLHAVVEWTDKAREYLKNKEYRFFSPVMWVTKGERRVAKIENIALTNYPKLNNLRPIIAKMGEQEATRQRGNANPKKEDHDMEFLKRLAAKLGITGDPDEAKVEAAVDAVIAKNTQLESRSGGTEVKEVVAKEVLEALDLKETDTASTVVASIHALKQSTSGAVSRAEFDALQKELRERDATAIVAKATADGKITPDQKDWAMAYARRDLEGFKVFAAKAPVVIPQGALPRQDKTPDAVVDAAVLTVAKLMGNTADDLKQFSGVTAQ